MVNNFSMPLWYLPLPGYLPQEYVTSVHNYSVPLPAPEGGIQLSPSPMPAPLWYQGPPKAYIQQVCSHSDCCYYFIIVILVSNIYILFFMVIPNYNFMVKMNI